VSSPSVRISTYAMACSSSGCVGGQPGRAWAVGNVLELFGDVPLPGLLCAGALAYVLISGG
jgi:hypothetical protein